MRSLLFIAFIHICFIGSGQNKTIETEISADNIFELSIIQVYPDSFPNVSVVFQAKNKKGEPLWLLKKDELVIKENSDSCEVLRLINITENKPINVGIVFDHSGSMFDNSAIGQDTVDVLSSLYFAGLPYPKDYVTSLDLAKDGVLGFIDDIESTSDSILFVGFSDEVDKVLPLSKDSGKIRSFMKNVEPSGSTAFYDALYLAIDSLSKHDSSPVIVSITDGQDNSSEHDYRDVIKNANKHGIPIYIIGLGDVDKQRLKRICRKTDGFFYQTNDPNKLKEIYANIKRQLKSIYQVDYRSLCKSLDSDERTISFSFINDTLTFSNNSEIYKLPEKAILYLQEQEDIRLAQIESDAQKEREKWILGGGIGGGILVLGIASFVIIKRRSKKKILLNNLFPNPFENEITLNYEIPNPELKAKLHMYDMNGVEIQSFDIDSYQSEHSVQLGNVNRGVYLFNISNGEDYSKTYKAVRK